jgi:hypothetical protein
MQGHAGMFPEKVEQNRELLYKFPLRDDRHGGGMNPVQVVIVGGALSAPPAMERILLDVITTSKIRPELDLQNKCVLFYDTDS